MTPFPPAALRPRSHTGLSRPERAFTIVEVLVVIALLALVSSLFVGGASDWLRARQLTPEDQFWQAIGDARQLALRTDQTVVLRYDEKTKQLRWSDGAAAQTLAWTGKSLEFLPVQENGSILIGGSLVETGRLDAVRFFADGSCDAFRVQITSPDGRRRIMHIDPWTCAPLPAGAVPH